MVVPTPVNVPLELLNGEPRENRAPSCRALESQADRVSIRNPPTAMLLPQWQAAGGACQHDSYPSSTKRGGQRATHEYITA